MFATLAATGGKIRFVTARRHRRNQPKAENGKQKIGDDTNQTLAYPNSNRRGE
jgi:hypothetical protein